MTRGQRLELLKQIEKDIHVCSIESTLLDDAKSCAIHSAIEELEQQPSEDCVSRQAVLDEIKLMSNANPSYWTTCNVIDREDLIDSIKDLPPVTPTHGTCKDCENWNDSDGVYRRGINAESKCSINNSRVFEGIFYCAAFEKRGNKNESIN